MQTGPPPRARHEITASIRIQAACVLAIVFNAIASPTNQTVFGTGPNPRRHTRMSRAVARPSQRQNRVLAKAERPVPHQAPRAQRQHPRAEVRHPAGQNQEPRIVGDKVKAAEPAATLPADPVVARRTGQSRSRKHRQRQPASPTVRDIAYGLASRLRVTREMMLLHHRAKAGLVDLRHHVQ